MADIISIILGVPSFLQNLRSLIFRQPHNTPGRDEALSLLDKVGYGILKYTEEHFELWDLKHIHEATQNLQSTFGRINEFKELLEPAEADRTYRWSHIASQWDFYRRIHLVRFNNEVKDLRTTREFFIELFDYQDKQNKDIEAFSTIAKFAGLITGNIQERNIDDLSQNLRILREIIDNAMVEADGRMRRKIDSLKEISIRLETNLESYTEG